MRSLDTMSPLAVMKRGYSITQKRSGDIVRDADSVKTGEQVDIRLANGSLKAKILSTSDE
jgi:exodeoxyribonuclease VII large subunit